MKLILATGNLDKIREIKNLLSKLDIEILTLADYPDIPEVVEDGLTLEENARKKAKTIYEATGIFSLADDTGLEVDALDGAPGVFSSRYAGDNVTYDDNVNKLLSEMKNVAIEKRTAQFRTVISLIGNNFDQTATGVSKGIIATEKSGEKGFGYDPVFFVPQYGKTFADMELSLKNKISHRGLALEKAKTILKNFLVQDI